MRRLVLLVTLGLAVLLAGPSAALALTRDEATRIALETLKPSEETGPVVVFGLPAPLKATQRLGEAGPATASAKTPRPRQVGRRAWLFWADLRPFARFQHPSRLLLVDDANGALLQLRNLRWYPEIDGRKPPFLRTRAAYAGARFRVYTNLPPGAFALRKAQSTRPLAPLAVPKSAFKDDCMITIGLTRDPQFAQDFVGMHAFARRVGIRSFWAQNPRRGGRTYGSHLRANVRHLVQTERCKDVFIYISGHGFERGVPAVTSDEKEANGTQPVVDAITLRRIMRDHPKITFKIKIDACYSGRFLPELRGRKNLLVLETSSAADEVSWSYLGTQYPTRDFEPQTRTGTNPNRGEFTNANLAGMEKFLASAQEVATARAAGGSLLAHMLARSYELGASLDLARTGEWTHPQLYTSLPEAPAPNLDFSLAYDHEGPGRSFICATITGTPGSTLEVELTGPDGSTVRGTLRLPEENAPTAHGTLSFGISSYGRYTVRITATKNGKSVTKSKAIDVTERPGTPACGP